MFEQMRDVALHGFELIELQFWIGNGENVAGFRLLVNKDPSAFGFDLLFHAQQSLALEHHRQDERRSRVARIVEFDQLSQERLGCRLLDRIDRRRRGRLVFAMPAGDKTFALAGLAVLLRPAFVADVDAQEIALLVEEDGVVALLVGERPVA